MPLPYLADNRPYVDAADLLASFGAQAAREAKARAAHSRRVGNYLHFCRWREVERLITAMAAEPDGATVH